MHSSRHATVTSPPAGSTHAGRQAGGRCKRSLVTDGTEHLSKIPHLPSVPLTYVRGEEEVGRVSEKSTDTDTHHTPPLLSDSWHSYGTLLRPSGSNQNTQH